MAKLSVIPTDLLEKLFELGVMGAVSSQDHHVLNQLVTLLDAKPSEPEYEEEHYQRFSICAPILNLTDMSRDDAGRFTHPRTIDAFKHYTDMMVRVGQDGLAMADKANSFFRGVGEVSARLEPQPETERGFERAFDLLTRLDPSMPLAQVMVWLREFLSGTQDAAVALTAAEGAWIPVEAGAPPEDAMVLVTCADWEPSIQRGEPAPIKAGYFENGVAKIFGASWKPTHWCLMPPPVFVHPKTDHLLIDKLGIN